MMLTIVYISMAESITDSRFASPFYPVQERKRTWTRNSWQ